MAPVSVLQLLDSAQGRPLQSWTIESEQRITIGRSPDNDVVVADPYVSRAHAYLAFDAPGASWRLISISRQQLSLRGELHNELALADGMVFRLGQHGCWLRFTQATVSADDRQTMSFDGAAVPLFVLDVQKVQREVSEIVEGDYFRNLKQVAANRRNDRFAADTRVS